MFDEYPDRLMLEQVAERIYRNVAGEEKNVEAEQYWGGMNPPPGPGMPPRLHPDPGCRHLRPLEDVMICGA